METKKPLVHIWAPLHDPSVITGNPMDKLLPLDTLVEDTDAAIVYHASSYSVGVSVETMRPFVETLARRNGMTGRHDVVKIMSTLNPHHDRWPNPYTNKGETWHDVPQVHDPALWRARVEFPFRQVAAMAELYGDVVDGFCVDVENYKVHPDHKLYDDFQPTALAYLREAIAGARNFAPWLDFDVTNADRSDSPFYRMWPRLVNNQHTQTTYSRGWSDQETSAPQVVKPTLQHIAEWETIGGGLANMVVWIQPGQFRIRGRDRGYWAHEYDADAAKNTDWPLLALHTGYILRERGEVGLYLEDGRLKPGGFFDCPGGCCAEPPDASLGLYDYVAAIRAGIAGDVPGLDQIGYVDQMEYAPDPHNQDGRLARQAVKPDCRPLPQNRKSGCADRTGA